MGHGDSGSYLISKHRQQSMNRNQLVFFSNENFNFKNTSPSVHILASPHLLNWILSKFGFLKEHAVFLAVPTRGRHKKANNRKEQYELNQLELGRILWLWWLFAKCILASLLALIILLFKLLLHPVWILFFFFPMSTGIKTAAISETKGNWRPPNYIMNQR